MDEWDDEDILEWLDGTDFEELIESGAVEMAELFFLSDNDFLPKALEEYELGFLEPEDWLPLVRQLDALQVDLEAVLVFAQSLGEMLPLPGLPTEVVEDPLAFLETVLEGNLPQDTSGRKIGSRRMVKIALLVTRLAQELPTAAQSAIHAWANVHRQIFPPTMFQPFGDEDLADLLFEQDLPPAVSGFSMLIGMTLMEWPDRADGLLPPGFADDVLFDDVLEQWVRLPDSSPVTEEGDGDAEALFSQGQLAHRLAQSGAVELMSSGDIEEEDATLAYSRLSRAILWIHNQCRHCKERNLISCQVASNWPERPVPLLDVAGEVANTGRIAGCIKM